MTEAETIPDLLCNRNKNKKFLFVETLRVSHRCFVSRQNGKSLAVFNCVAASLTVEAERLPQNSDVKTRYLYMRM